MNKKLIFMLMLGVAFSANAKMESAKSFKFSGDTDYASFCKAVITDDVELLKRSIRDKVGEVASSSKHVLQKLIAADGMKCNDVNLVEFSQQREAKAVNAYLTQN